MSVSPMSADEWTFGAHDLVPVTPGADNLNDTLGFQARGLRADDAGEVVCRFIKSDADRTINVQAGEVIVGFVTHVKSGTTATVHAIR